MTQDFTSFGLPPRLQLSIARAQFKTPTPIQAMAIPLALAGRDVLGSAQTGTGKTGAFGIPLIARLMQEPQSAALIMTPTRELAAQVQAALEQLIPTQDMKTALLIGGESMPRQFHQLKANPQIIVGTPGRINDHLQRRNLRLGYVRFLVLDETDRMLDMGFGIQIDKIIQQLPRERQTMMFSATLPADIVKLAGKYLNNPERISAGSTTTPIAKIKQELIQTTEGEKYQSLITQLSQRSGSIIIFVKTKHGTERLAKRLNTSGQKADAIHGDLQQRRRDSVIQNFRAKTYRILVATDVAARGLDIPHIEHVINYDLPQCPEDYIHRIGRTARAGAEGAAVNLITPADGDKWRAIHRLMHPGEAQQGGHSSKGGHPNAGARHGGKGRKHRGFKGGFGKDGDGFKGGEGGFKLGKRAGGSRRRDKKSFGGASSGGHNLGGQNPGGPGAGARQLRARAS